MKHLFDSFHEPPSETNFKKVGNFGDLDMSRGAAIIPYGSEDDNIEEDQFKSPDLPFTL